MTSKVIKSVVMGYVVSIILLLIFALIMFYGEISDKIVSIFVISTYFISNIFAGITIGKNANSRKFLWGIVVGGLYFIIILLFSLIGKENVDIMNSSVIIGLFSSLFGGMIGGMIS